MIKKGFLKRAKEFFKRIISIVTEKIKNFGKFIKEKVRDLFDKIQEFKLRLQGSSSDEIEKFRSMRDENRRKEAELKEFYKTEIREILQAKDVLVEAINELEDTMRYLFKIRGEVSEVEYSDKWLPFTVRADEMIRSIDSFNERVQSFTKADGGPERDRHIDSYKMTIKSTIQTLDHMSKTAKVCLVVSDKYIKKLDYFKNYLELTKDSVGDNARSKIFGMITKLNSFIGKIGSGINKIWAKIFSSVGKIFKSFGKKKED